MSTAGTHPESYTAQAVASTSPQTVAQLLQSKVATIATLQQQMRRSDKGAHALVQVRAAVLNGKLIARARTVPWYNRPAKNACQFEDFEELAA